MEKIRKYDRDGQPMVEDQSGRMELYCDLCGQKSDWLYWKIKDGRVIEICRECKIKAVIIKTFRDSPAVTA